MTRAFPLQWPIGRSKTRNRKNSAFKVKPTQAYDEMMAELKRFGATHVVVSSNIPTRRDGTPYRDGLADTFEVPGVAVYFLKGKRQVCLPCDTYRKPWENCRAIGVAVKGFRDMERHGAHQILDQAFEGFTALPAPNGDAADAKPQWFNVLGVQPTASKSEITSAYRNIARRNSGASVELNAAKEEGLAVAND